MKHPGDLLQSFVKHNIAPVSAQPKAPINAFQSLFAVQELSSSEKSILESVFFQDGQNISEEQIQTDFREVERLTKELKAIRKQGVVFIGERICAVREVFRKYKERSFREWMKMTFGSFKTGYNYLAFYELYVALPQELQERLVLLSAKEAYKIASKEIPLEEKIKTIAQKESSKNDVTIDSSDFIESKISSMVRHVHLLKEISASLSEQHKNRLKELLDMIEDICLS